MRTSRGHQSVAAPGGTARTRARATRTSTTGPTTRTRTSGRAAAVTIELRLGDDHGRPGRPFSIKVDGQPGCPASANTLQDPAERGVECIARRYPRPDFLSVKWLE